MPWAPPLAVVVRPEERAGRPGTRCTGALLHHLHAEHVETVLLSPEGMEMPWLHDIRHLTYAAPG